MFFYGMGFESENIKIRYLNAIPFHLSFFKSFTQNSQRHEVIFVVLTYIASLFS